MVKAFNDTITAISKTYKLMPGIEGDHFHIHNVHFIILAKHIFLILGHFVLFYWALVSDRSGPFASSAAFRGVMRPTQPPPRLRTWTW